MTYNIKLLGYKFICISLYFGGVIMKDLTSKKCVPCSIGAIPLSADEIQDFLKDLDSGWEVKDDVKIEKKYKFKDFKEALDFTNKIGELAEEQGHHPTISLAWGQVIITIWTHKIKGLHDNDFILAAKINQL